MGKIAKKQTQTREQRTHERRHATPHLSQSSLIIVHSQSAIYVSGEKSERSRVARFHREGARTATTVFGGGTPRWRRVARR